MTARSALLLTNALGGAAVIASYVQGMSSPHTASGAIWGGVPESARWLYTTSMLCAASGYFPFTYLFAFGVDPQQTRFMGKGMGLVTACYGLVLLPSAMWLPLTAMYLDAPSALGWVAIQLVLALVALGSIGLLACLFSAKPRPGQKLRVGAIVGCLFFCFQTVVLDAIVWVIRFPT